MSPGALWPERVRYAFVMIKVFYEIQLFDSGPGRYPKNGVALSLWAWGF